MSNHTVDKTSAGSRSRLLRGVVFTLAGGVLLGALGWSVLHRLHPEPTAAALAPVPPALAPATRAKPQLRSTLVNGVEVLIVELDPADWRGRIVAAADKDPFQAQSSYVMINGGYFDAAGAPDGLVLIDGTVWGALRKDGVYSGFAWADASGAVHIEKRATAPGGAVRWAIQSGPMLIEAGGRIDLHANDRLAPRSALALRAGKLFIVRTGRIGLRDLAEALKSEGVEGAINLDGGPSSDLHACWPGDRIDRPGILPGLARVPYFLGFAPRE